VLLKEGSARPQPRANSTSPTIVAKWVTRFRTEGVDGLRDRSSRPHSLPGQTPAATCATVEALRRQRHTGRQIAAEVGISPATVSRILRWLGLNRLAELEPAEPIRRYEREHSGELIHLDIKKLGRIGSVGHRITGRYPGAINRHHGIGWEFVHVCIDDASRIAFVQVMADQRKESAVAFLEAAVTYFARLGVRVERVMTDNGSCYRSRMFRAACRRLGLSPNLHQAIYPEDQRQGRALHPNFPSRMGICPRLPELRSTISRAGALAHRYNWHRPHGSLKANTPISRLGLARNNLLRPYIDQCQQTISSTLKAIVPAGCPRQSRVRRRVRWLPWPRRLLWPGCRAQSVRREARAQIPARCKARSCQLR
jgi:transposase InsO family protein